MAMLNTSVNIWPSSAGSLLLTFDIVDCLLNGDSDMSTLRSSDSIFLCRLLPCWYVIWYSVPKTIPESCWYGVLRCWPMTRTVPTIRRMRNGNCHISFFLFI